MMASSWSMSAAMCSRASASATLISVSRRRRASGVRRSCEMPASMTARSCSILASCWAMRLKPMLTSRISLVTAFSSSRLASKSPSRTRLAANDSCLSGRLISRAISAAPVSDRPAAVISQISQVRAAHVGEAGAVQQHPVRVGVDLEADPQAFLAVDAGRHHGARAQPRQQLVHDARVELAQR